MNRCEDCGCKIIDGHCVNCHEEVFIADQYRELNMPMSEAFAEIVDKQLANPSIAEEKKNRV